MALSAAEQQRMAQLEQEVGHMVPSGGQTAAGLSPEEHKRMQQLEGEVGHLLPQAKPNDHWYDISGRGMVQGALDTLPTIGGVGGGALAAGGAIATGVGIPAAGLAGVGGAGLGAMGGQSLKSLGERYLLGKGENANDMYENLAMAGQHGAEQQMFGGLMNEAAGAFTKSGVSDIGKNISRPGSMAIRAAASRLGVEPTQGMLTDDYTTRNLENSLSQSPSLPGSWVRSEQRPVSEAINNTTENALSDASQQSDYEAGRGFKKDASDYFKGRYEPIQQSYNEIESHTSNIPLNDKGLSRIANNIRGLDEAKFEGSEGHQIASQFADWMEGAENVNDLKTLKTKARQIAQDPNSSYEAKSVASSIMGKLEQAERNSVMRQAVQVARESSPGGGILKGARINSAEDGISLSHKNAAASGEFLHPDTLDERLEMTPDQHGLNYERPFYIESAEVNPSMQGQGLGSASLHKIEQEAIKQGADGFVLNASPQGTSIGGKHTARDESRLNDLVRFYEKNGYTPIKDEGGNVLMHKPIGTPSAPIPTALDQAEGEGRDLGRKLIGDIKSTNKQYRGLMEDARAFGKGTGLTRADKGMSAMLDDIESARPEEAAKALFDPNNVDFMKFAKDKMPEQFEAARRQKLAEVLHKTGGDPAKLLKFADKMGPEARGLLFGENNVESLSDANTLLQSVPKKVGASDTPRGLEFQDILSPTKNIMDLGRYGLLKAKPKISAAAQAVQRYTPMGQGLLMQGLQKNK